MIRATRWIRIACLPVALAAGMLMMHANAQSSKDAARTPVANTSPKASGTSTGFAIYNTAVPATTINRPIKMIHLPVSLFMLQKYNTDPLAVTYLSDN